MASLIMLGMGIIPAHAGNTVLRQLLLVRSGDHPRACGEHPETFEKAYRKQGSSPRMRGTRSRGDWCGGTAGDHPRACGEHRRYGGGELRREGSSPRMRGTPQSLGDLWRVAGIIPAHAGNTNVDTFQTLDSGDHPRACGEHLQFVNKCQCL